VLNTVAGIIFALSSGRVGTPVAIIGYVIYGFSRALHVGNFHSHNFFVAIDELLLMRGCVSIQSDRTTAGRRAPIRSAGWHV